MAGEKSVGRMREQQNKRNCNTLAECNGTAGTLVLTQPLPFLACVLPDNWNVDGVYGELHINGDFVEGHAASI